MLRRSAFKKEQDQILVVGNTQGSDERAAS